MLPITREQCGDMLALWLAKSSSPEAVKRIVKETGYNDSPFFGAQKKKVRIMGEVVMANTALAILAVNQVFGAPEDAKVIIDTFLSAARRSMFTFLEGKDSGFKQRYEQRLAEYFKIFGEKQALLGMTFVFMQSLDLDPIKQGLGQLQLTERFGCSLNETIDVLRRLDVDGSGQATARVREPGSGPPASMPTLPALPKGRARSALNQALPLTDVERLIDIARALADDLAPWIFEQSGRDRDGRMKGGLRMESTSPSGETIDMDAMLIAFVEEGALAFSFGLVVLVATVHSNTWAKSPACKRARERIAPVLAEKTQRQFQFVPRPPPKTPQQIAAETLIDITKAAELDAHKFSKPYYDNLYGTAKTSGAPPRSGVEELHEWLRNPARRSDNPVGFLEATLAKRSGNFSGGHDWEATVEKVYGKITRALILQAIDLMRSPTTPRAEEDSPTETSAPRAAAVTASSGTFIGMMDIDNFDLLNDKLGRAAGDQVMKAYKRLAATQAKVGSILNETGFMALQGELARTGAALNEFVLCFPYSSGDEFIIQHQDPEKIRSALESMQRAADGLELPILDGSGATVALLHGIPVSIGWGRIKDEAWKGVIAQKQTETKKKMGDRIEVLKEPRHGAPAAQRGIADAVGKIFRERPGTDPETGLPTTIEVTAEESPRGSIPVLMWGPVETRRPGWTKTHHEKMCREIVGHMVSLGISDSSRFKETTEEVAQLSDQIWNNLVQAMAKARSRQG